MKSILINDEISCDMNDNCGKQHCVKIPCNIKFLWNVFELLKLDHIELMKC